uniref:Mitochondrial inner membrane protease subunit n=2 Tax=Culicoides sonorensis TaxID=179676 RepID=A0A336MZM0_CULSO
MNKIFSKVTHYASVVVQVSAVSHCFFEYVLDFVLCSGSSMEPTLYSNNVLVTDRMSPRLGKIDRGDVIIAKNPNIPNQLVCKRIIGLPGDIILAQDTGAVTNNAIEAVADEYLSDEPINGKLPNDKSKDDQSIKYKKVVIPRGYIWIEGDNSVNSSDSRHYGPIPLGLLQSKVLCRIYPFKQIGLIS